MVYSEVDREYKLLYACMGHLNEDALAKLQRATTGVPISITKTNVFRGGVLKGK